MAHGDSLGFKYGDEYLTILASAPLLILICCSQGSQSGTPLYKKLQANDPVKSPFVLLGRDPPCYRPKPLVRE